MFLNSRKVERQPFVPPTLSLLVFPACWWVCKSSNRVSPGSVRGCMNGTFLSVLQERGSLLSTPRKLSKGFDFLSNPWKKKFCPRKRIPTFSKPALLPPSAPTSAPVVRFKCRSVISLQEGSLFFSECRVSFFSGRAEGENC